jgi:hypothetical protein
MGNKLRSILTLMGVMIGVAAVIMVITLVNGANKFVATKVYGYGADVFTASKQPSVVFSDAEYNKYQKRKDLKIDDYREVAAKCKDCASTGAMASTTGKVVYNSHSSTDTSVRGWTWTMPPIYNINIDRGRVLCLSMRSTTAGWPSSALTLWTIRWDRSIPSAKRSGSTGPIYGDRRRGAQGQDAGAEPG